MSKLKISLKKLELTNYRNIDHTILEFDGNSKIVGENRIGKTNILESICFLLTDTLLNGSNDLPAIKPLKDTKLVVRVEGVFQVGEQEITLKKEYGENWTKQRNTGELVFKGHYEEYYYNGVKQGTLRDYNNLVSEDFKVVQSPTTKIDFLQMLINPYHLANISNSVDWTQLRAFIIEMVGDVSDDDVFEKEPTIVAIKGDLAKVNGRMDQLKKQYKGEIDNLKNEIIGNDAQIELLEKTECPNDTDIAVAKKGIEDADNQINALKSKNGVDTLSITLREQIANKKNEILELQNKEKEELNKNDSSKTKLDELLKKSNELIEKKDDTTISLNKIKREIMNQRLDFDKLDKDIDGYIEELNKIDNDIKYPMIETTCPTCHRPLDKDIIEKTKNDYISSLKSKREELIAKGLKAKADKEAIQKVLDEKTTKAASLEKELENFKNDYAQIKKEYDELKSKSNDNFTNYIPSAAVDKLVEEQKELEKKLDKANSDYLTAQSEVNNQILALNQDKTKFQEVINNKNYYDKQMTQLENVKQERSINSALLVDKEQKVDLINKFIFTKLNMLDENVSKVFGNIRFQLIKENINGGYDTVCKPYIYNIDKDESTNVLWNSGSKSEQVITGIAIVEKIKEYLKLPHLPYLFDEGGEISTDTFKTKFKTDAQLICVKVQDNIPSPMVLSI